MFFLGNNSQNTGLVDGKDEAEIRWRMGSLFEPAASHQSGSRRVTEAQPRAMLLQRVRQMSQSKEARTEPVRDEEVPHIRG